MEDGGRGLILVGKRKNRGGDSFFFFWELLLLEGEVLFSAGKLVIYPEVD